MQGQLVPVAIPLGKPRMDPGLAMAADQQPHPVSADHVRSVVTAATNVAMVAMTADDEGPVRERVLELGRQVGLCKNFVGLGFIVYSNETFFFLLLY